MTEPHKNNACAGAYPDWLDVLLTDKCNAQCSWCIEKDGYHPKERVDVDTLIQKILETGKQKIMLLGGEPCLYKDLPILIQKLSNRYSKSVYLTTNGSGFGTWKLQNLHHLTGINISIHHFALEYNKIITGIDLVDFPLKEVIEHLRNYGVLVRLNCNLIKNYIDDRKSVENYIDFAKNLNVDKVRFSELAVDSERFVSAYEILNMSLDTDPFVKGCSVETGIHGMPINFRIMCGLQTNKRPAPKTPRQSPGAVLYYNGKLYDGWQKEEDMSGREHVIKDVLKKVKEGELTLEQAESIIKTIIKNEKTETVVESVSSGFGCRY